MQCCGQVPIDITTQTDRCRTFFCGICGRQGAASEFPDPQPPPEPPASRMDRARLWLADLLYRAAELVTPRL